MKDIILHPKNRFTWTFLAFQGGFVNTGGLITVHVFVSHVTGFATHFSLEAHSQNFLRALYFLLVPCFFLMGAFATSLFAELRKRQKKEAVYLFVLLILSMAYSSIALLGEMNFFGSFGEPFSSFRDFVLLSILAFSCGAQNALFTHYSGSILRTTHLTGLTTDLGIGLAKTLVTQNPSERYVNRIRVDLILSFVFGSFGAAVVFGKLQFLGFLIPAGISLLVGLRLFQTRKQIQNEA